MDTSQSLRRAETIECWDDDPDFADLDLTHPTTSSSPADTRAAMDHHYHHRRESWSSRMSIQSGGYDFDSPDGVDHEQQVLLDDSPATAIASAINAGIPIPENVPSSALVGGTIKRLGTIRKNRKITAHDDWGEDLEIPTSDAMLKVRKTDNHEFPDSLQQFQSGDRSRNSSPFRDNLAPVIAASSKLNKYREAPDDEDIFGDCDDIPTLKLPPVKRTVEPKRSMASLLMTPPLSESATRGSPSIDDDFENDFEFPADAPLQLNIKSGESSRQPAVHGLDSDCDEWADGGTCSSLGTRYASAGRDFGRDLGRDRGRNDDRRSSSTAMLSPTMSSVTAESEEEAPLEGLELPEGILPNFQALLERRKQTASLMDVDMTFQGQKESVKDEFFEGIEIGDGDVFDARKLTLNRNVKHKPSTARQTSPVRRGTMSLVFTTSKAKAPTPPPLPPTPTSANARRLHHGHPTLASPIPVLEPVEEKETPQPVTKKKAGPRSRWSGKKEDESRWSGNDAFAVNIPPPPPIPQTRTDRTRPALGNKQTGRAIRSGNMQENAPPPTTTNAQLLRMKRSLPNIQGPPRNSPAKPPRPPSRNNAPRPPSRNSQGRPPSSNGRPSSNNAGPAARPPSRSSSGRPPSRTEVISNSGRPKTPAERMDMNLTRKPAPFLPAGGSLHQSHHISAKINRVYDKAIDPRTDSRLRSRITPRHSPSSSLASNGTKRSTPSVAPEHLRREAAAIVPLTQPTRKRNFGDGTELEIFDDLPTSAKLENKFVVTPVGRGAPKTSKAKNVQTVQAAGSTCSKDSDHPPAKRLEMSSRFANQDSIPRFARDTNASRIAREQRMGITSSSNSGASHWKSQLAARTASPKNRKKPQQKPHLIKPLGNISSLPKAQAVNGMTYNPRTYRWEGNEAEVRNFENQNTTPPRPALITNVNTSGSKMGIQVVGGMVFDPSRMCWLKVDEDPDDSDDDPFEGVEDLMDHDMVSIDGHSGGMLSTGGGVAGSVGAGGFGNNGAGMFGGGGARMSGGFGEFVVGEEFDVGPEFMRRQREEEDKWRKKVDGWISPSEAAKTSNRWALRELLVENRL